MGNSNNPSWLKPLSIAASLLILIAAGIYFFTSTPANSKDPFTKFYKPETKNLSSILDRLESSGFADSDGEKKDSLARSLHQYEVFEYSKAIVSLNEYLESYPEDKTAKLYLGLSLLQQSEFAKAAKHLAPLTKDNDFESQSTAKWYLALAYTQFNTPQSTKNAIKLFNQLTTENADYAEEATEYLRILNN